MFNPKSLLGVVQNGGENAKLSRYKKFEEYVEEHPLYVYIDYRDELTGEQVSRVLKGEADEVRWSIEDSLFCDADDREYWDDMAEELGVAVEEIKEWLADDGFHPSYVLSNSGWNTLVSNSGAYIRAVVWDADFNIGNWAYGSSIEYRDVKETFKILGINPAEFKSIVTGEDARAKHYKFKGYFPNMPNRVPSVDVKNFHDNILCLYDGVLTFCLGDLGEVEQVLDSKKVTFKAGTNFVIYDFNNGAGIVEGTLQTDVTIPRKRVNFNNDDTDEYGIQACYGFTRGFWSDGSVEGDKR